MLEALVLLAGLFVGMILLGVFAVKAIVIFFKVGFWALTLPLQILLGLTGAVVGVLFGVLVPVLVILGLVGVAVTLPLLLVAAIPCLIIGLGICLVVGFFC